MAKSRYGSLSAAEMEASHVLRATKKRGGNGSQPAAESLPQSERVRGVVKWFSFEKGFGFIVSDGYAGDVFVHGRELRASGIDTLGKGQHVSFIVEHRKGGAAATEIRLEEDGVEWRTGVVKLFKDREGYAFVVPSDGGDDVFLHYKTVQESGFDTRRLCAGTKVLFVEESRQKGLAASRVRIVS